MMHADLKLGFGVGVGLVNQIAVRDTCTWYGGLGPVSRSRQIIQLGQQQSLVPV